MTLIGLPPQVKRELTVPWQRIITGITASLDLSILNDLEGCLGAHHWRAHQRQCTANHWNISLDFKCINYA